MTAPLTACGDDPPPPKTAVKKKILVSTTAKSEASGGLENGGDRAANGAKPSRKSDPLTREDFGPDLRDPFKSFLIDETIQAADEAPVVAERQRNVQMPSYNFEDLSLVGIIRSKRGVEPRALFVATDGISGTIKQGQYFSRAEVLLSSVNTGYVEIEIVDENLAKGLNLTNGETRAIYLKRE
jgi:Tfp pilus assembly protein PilP